MPQDGDESSERADDADDRGEQRKDEPRHPARLHLESACLLLVDELADATAASGSEPVPNLIWTKLFPGPILRELFFERVDGA